MKNRLLILHTLPLYLITITTSASSNAYRNLKQDEIGDPLLLTPLIQQNQIEEARLTAEVNSTIFLGIKSYSGYFTVNETYNSNLFFWFFPSQSDYENDPVVLWLQGGPGETSLFGLFIENGPFSITDDLELTLRETSWTKSHSVLYIDNPVGVGYSFTNGGYAQNETKVGQDLYNALVQFFTVFPELQKNEFYISGETYGGKFVPAIGYRILKENPGASLKINLQGLVIGDGFTDPEYLLNYGDYLFQIGLIDSNTRDKFKELEEEMCPNRIYAITTVHHDKPEESSISKMAKKMTEEVVNITLAPAERQKRLMPYENFYSTQSEDQFEPQGQFQRYQFDRVPAKKAYPQYNRQHQFLNQDDLYQTAKDKFTPFLESNAIPGPFRPISHDQQHVQYISQAKSPDYSVIYDKLSQLKLENSRRPIYIETYRNVQPIYISKPQANFIPESSRYKNVPDKTTVESYVATNIDVPSEPERYNFPRVTPARFQENVKPYINQQVAAEIPQQPYATFLVRKPYQGSKGKPYVLLQARPQDQRTHLQQAPVQNLPIIVLQKTPVPVYNKPISKEKYEPVTFLPQYEDRYQPQYVTPKYEEYATPETYTPTESPTSLGNILKQLQATNTLPQNLTPDNIDNSIKTLVKILEALKTRQKVTKPIVVEDDVSGDYNEEENNEADVGGEKVVELPGTVTQNFPGVAPDGGTPGKPGVDYPALSSIPQTSFNCKTQRYKGFFGDPDTNCQVWHYCDLNGGQASFLCPNGTIFSQVALTCDWWYNVKCSSTAQLYVLNERLYKYIIPLSPKFPEDYSGPLVDKYLALKFQEMEEKMKKEKADKEETESKEKETEDLQDIVGEDTKKAQATPKKPATIPQERETLETIEDDNNKE